MSGRDFVFYADAKSVYNHFDQVFAKIPDFSFPILTDIDQFVGDVAQIKIAGFHVAFPANTDWVSRLVQVRDLCFHVFVFCSELHADTVSQLRLLDHDKISVYICGQLNQPLTRSKINYWMDWFHTSSDFYARTQPGFLDTRLDPYSPKIKSFDILLGNARPHRTFVFNYVNSNFAESAIMTYVYYAHRSIINNDQFIMETDGVELDPDRKYHHSVDIVKYHGEPMTLSQLVPLSIYGQSAYTVVTETNFENSFNFYTEKIVKPILGKRLFVAIAGQNYLKNLRQFGFRTFDGIIDESYDAIEDNETRWHAALDQSRLLCSRDQAAVLHAIRDTVKHNYKLMTAKDWYSEFLDSVKQELLALVNDAKISPACIA